MATGSSLPIRLARWLASFPLIILVIVFAVSNRQDVSFYWSPFNPPLELPFCLFILASAALGFIGGAIVSWLHAAHLRRECRAQKRELADLEGRLKHAQAGVEPPLRKKSFYTLPNLLPRNRDTAL